MENKIKVIKVALVEKDLYESEIYESEADKIFDIFMSYDYACSMCYDITNKTIIYAGDNIHDSGNDDFYEGYKYGLEMAKPGIEFEVIEEVFVCEDNNTYCFEKVEKWLTEKYNLNI